MYRQGCVSRTTLKLSHSPHNLAHSSTCTCCRHCTAARARAGRPGLGREAVQQRLHSSAAQQRCSMKEPPAAVLVRHDVDRLGQASSVSSESGSLELLLTLDALVGAAILRRTNGCSSTARARCAAQPPLSRAHAHTSRGCARQGCGVMRHRAGPASLHPRPTSHVSCGPYPVLYVTFTYLLELVHTYNSRACTRTTTRRPI